MSRSAPATRVGPAVAAGTRSHGAAVLAVAVVFTAAGLVMAAAVSRMPEIKGQVHASATELAFALVCVGIGSVVAMPFAGRMVGRFGTSAVCRVFATAALVGWSLVPLARSVPELAGILLLTGAGVGTWDVAMNVQGSIVERASGRVLMPRWHGLFSVGGVVGALAGAGAARWGIPLGWQLPVVAAVLWVAVQIGCRAFLPESAGEVVVAVGDAAGGAGPSVGAQPAVDAQAPVPGRPGSGDDDPGVLAGHSDDGDSHDGCYAHARPDRARAYGPTTDTTGTSASIPEAPREAHRGDGGPKPVTGPPAASHPVARAAVRTGITRVELLLGLITLGTALGEGAANDWLAVALVDERGAPAAIGALTYAGFNVTMAIGRFSGGPLIARFGRVAALRGAGTIAATGVLLLCLVPGTGVALVGAAAWGLGLAIVFPSAMSAAGEVPGRTGRAIATVSTIGYGGFLLGAPTIGLLAHAIPLLDALLVVAAFAILIVLLAPAARERHRPGRSPAGKAPRR